MQLDDVINKIDAPLNVKDLIDTLNSAQHQCVFIKDINSRYQYANNNFLDVMGLHSMAQLKQSTDLDLSKNKQDAYKYRELDCCVLEEKKY